MAAEQATRRDHAGTATRWADRLGPAGRPARIRRWLERARGSDGHERHTLLLIGKCAVAACLAWIVSYDLMQAQSPAFAPFTAVLMVQVTVYRSIAQSLRYILAVTVGVAVQGVLAFMAGPDLLTFAAVALIALTLGRWRRLGEQGPQVATAAFFAFSTFVTETSAPARIDALGQIVLLVLVGCAIGVLVNLLIVPPMRYRSAEYGVRALAHTLGDLVTDMSEAMRGNDLDKERTELWRYRAGRIGSTVSLAHSAVRTAEESVSFNPRRLLGRHRTHTSFAGYSAVVDALERVSGQLSSVARTLDQNDDAARTDDSHRAFIRDYGDFLAAIGEITGRLSVLDDDRLAAQSADMCEAAEAAGTAHDRLREKVDGSTLDLTNPANAYGTMLVDAGRLMAECRYTCDVLKRCVEEEAEEVNRAREAGENGAVKSRNVRGGSTVAEKK